MIKYNSKWYSNEIIFLKIILYLVMLVWGLSFALCFKSFSLCNILLRVGAFVWLYSMIFFFKANNNFKDCILIQFLTVNLLCFLFFLISYMCSYRNGVIINNTNALSLIMSFSIGTLICMILYVQKFKQIKKSFVKYCSKNKYIFLLIFFIIIQYLPVFSFLFKSDSNTYYATLVENTGTWDFNIKNIDSFQLGYHATYGYSIFAFIGNSIISKFGIGIRLVNLFFIIITVMRFNDIIKKLFNDRSKIFYFSLCGLFAFNPLILGLEQEISIDFPMLCFFILFLWAYIYQKNIYMVFYSMCLCFSKEIGIVFLLGFSGGIVLYRIILNIIQKEKTVKILKSNELRVLYSILIFIINLLTFSIWGAHTSDIKTKNNLINSFHFNFKYIIIKIKQMFIFNFQWVVVLIIILGLILGIKNRIKIKEIDCGIIFSFLSFLIFQLSYFTYTHYRYLIPMAFFTAIFLGYILNWKFEKEFIRIIILFFCMTLFTIQSYFFVDPISNNIFKKIKTGNGFLISQNYMSSDKNNPEYMIYEENGGDLSNEVFRDYTQNNRKYECFEICFEKAFSKIDYSENTGILISPIYDDGFWGKDKWTFSNLFGTLNRESIRWNEHFNQLTYEKNDTKINWINSENYTKEMSKYDKVWYFEFKYPSNFEFENYISKMNIIESFDINYYGWQISVYRIK